MQSTKERVLDVAVFDVQMDAGMVGVVSVTPAGTTFANGIPTEAIVGTVSAGTREITPSDFTPNPAFVQFLHEVIAKHGPSSPEFRDEALRQQTGFLYVIDLRVGDTKEAVPPEDILGFFELREGVPVSYKSNPRHQLLTERGLLVLDPWLESKVLDEIAVLG